MSRYGGETDIIAIFQKKFEDQQRQIDKLINEGGLFPEPWREIGGSGNPAFAANFSNYGSGYATVGFRKEDNGVVRLKGLVANGVATGTIFTLPSGYAPSLIEIFAVQNNGSIFADLRV